MAGRAGAPTPDREQYVSLVTTLAYDGATKILLDILHLDPPTRVVQSIGRELSRLDAEAAVLEWLACRDAEQRLAASKLQGFCRLRIGWTPK